MGKTWKVIELLQTVTKYLDEKDIENPRLNAELLLGKVLNLKRVNLYLEFERPLSQSELETYRELVKRRAEHEPLQYILGETEFMGLKFAVKRGVLIPRPETEILVDEVLKIKDELSSVAPAVIDIGSGSGCIAISLARQWLEAQIFATDISEEAVEMIRENALLNQVEGRIEIIKHDIFSDWDDALPKKPDVIISNPPYIGSEEIKTLPKEVSMYEPETALTDRADGLSFYRRFFQLITEGVISTKYLFLEMSGTQPEKIIEMCGRFGLPDTEVINDLNNIQRVLKVKVY